MSETPRTGKNRVRFSTLCHTEDAWWVHEKVSAQLERELNAATDRIKRLEEVGDKMEIYCDTILARDWKEAKEAKL